MAPPGSDPTEMIWLLRGTARRYAGAVRAELDAKGFADLPQRGFWALNALATPGRSASDLVPILDVTKQMVSQLVESLVDLGYVERRADPADRRRTELALTARGARAAGSISRACARVEAELGARMGEKGFAAVRTNLRTVGSPPRTASRDET